MHKIYLDCNLHVDLIGKVQSVSGGRLPLITTRTDLHRPRWQNIGKNGFWRHWMSINPSCSATNFPPLYMYITVDVVCWRREIKNNIKEIHMCFFKTNPQNCRKTGCSGSAKSFARSSLSSSPSFSSAVAWFGQMSKKNLRF